MKQSSLQLSLLLWASIYLSEKNKWLLLIPIIYCMVSYCWRQCFLFLVLLGLVIFPRWNHNIISYGKIIEVKNENAIVQQQFTKVLLTNCTNCIVDSTISFQGEIMNESFISSYGFDYDKYLQRKGVYTKIKVQSMSVLRESDSFRGNIHQHILNNFPKEHRNVLLKTLFNSSNNDSELSFLMSSGYGYVGLLSLISFLLKFIINKQKRQWIECLYWLLISLFYHFPLFSSYQLIKKTLRFTSLSSVDRLAISAIAMMVLFSYETMLLSFVIPFMVTLLHHFYRNEPYKRIHATMICHSVLFHQINVLSLFFFPFVSKVIGIITIFSFFLLWTQHDVFYQIIVLLNNSMTFPMMNLLHGTPLSTGLPLYVGLYVILKKKRVHDVVYISLYVLFMYCGLFSLHREVIFINVGQGDSILFRDFFNQTTVLIDTGKKTAFSHVNTMLKAKGIKEIDAIFISHLDEDHVGGLELIKEHYHVKEVVFNHFDERIIDSLQFIDLNTISNDNENDSSQVLYVVLDDVSFLLTGDISLSVEEEMMKKYPSLSVSVLKLSHHGSKTSTGDSILTSTRPKLSIISSGKQSLYNHPHPSVIERLKKYHIPYVITAKDGDIHVHFIGWLKFFTTSSGKIGIIT